MQFVQVTLSAIYHDCLKDRLYTWAKSGQARRSAQTVIALTFDTLVRILAPMLPFTADEAWAYRAEGVALAKVSVHEQPFPAVPVSWSVVKPVAADVEAIMALKAKANESMEAMRAAKEIGKSLEAELVFSGEVALLEKYRAALPEIFIVSKVILEPGAGGLTVRAQKAPGQKCPRCWRYVENFEGDTCPRCAEALRDA